MQFIEIRVHGEGNFGNSLLGTDLDGLPRASRESQVCTLPLHQLPGRVRRSPPRILCRSARDVERERRFRRLLLCHGRIESRTSEIEALKFKVEIRLRVNTIFTLATLWQGHVSLTLGLGLTHCQYSRRHTSVILLSRVHARLCLSASLSPPERYMNIYMNATRILIQDALLPICWPTRNSRESKKQRSSRKLGVPKPFHEDMMSKLLVGGKQEVQHTSDGIPALHNS